MMKGISKIFSRKNSEEEQPRLNYTLISIEGPNKIKIYSVPPEELPKDISMSHACEIEDSHGNRAIGFVVVKHNLEPLVDVPIVETYLKEHQYLPIDVKRIFDYKVEELKHDLYEAFEIALAGKWARLVYEKGYEFKVRDWKGIAKWLVLAAIIGAIAFVAYTMFIAPHAATHAAATAGKIVSKAKVT